MSAVKIFDNIAEDDLHKMLECFRAKRKKFAAGSNITAYSGSHQNLCILLSGEADLVRFDYDGSRNIMEHLATGDVFGEMFTQSAGGDELAVLCEHKCEVLFLDHRSVAKRCPNACPYHSMLVGNVLRIMGEKLQDLRTHLEVLSQRSLRTKLMTYFRMTAKQAGSDSFTLPFTLADLADYLYVDRSAMLREMKNLREDNQIVSHGRKITLKQK